MLKIKLNRKGLSKSNILILIMLCIFLCHSISFLPQVIVAIIMLIHFLVKKLTNHGKLMKTTRAPLIWNIGFVLWAVLSTMWARDTSLVLAMIPNLFVRVIFSLYILDFMTDYEATILCIKDYIIACLYMIFRMLIYMIMNPANYLDNVEFYEVCSNACETNFNQVAQTISFCMLFMFFLYEKERKRYYLVLNAVFYIIILLTGSRKGLVIPIVGLALFVFIHDWHRIVKQLRNIVLFTLGALIIIFFLSRTPVIYERLRIVVNALLNGESGDMSTSERLYFISIASDMFVQKPVLGWGLNNFRGILASTGYSNVVYCHNNYLEIASGLGVIGLAFYYWFYIIGIKKGFAWLKKKFDVALSISMFILFVIFEYGIVTYPFGIYMYVILVAYMFMVHSSELKRVN